MNPARLIRNQPLLMVTLAYLSGIILALAFPGIEVPLLLTTCTALLAIILLRYQENIGFLTLMLLFLLLGIHLTVIESTPPQSESHIRNRLTQLQGEVSVVGRVLQVFSYTGEVTRFDIDTIAARSADTDFLSSKGRIRYTLKAPFPASISPGDTVLVRARLRPPHRFATPGVFDYPSFLARKDIYVTGYLRSPLFITDVKNHITTAEMLTTLPEQLRYTINRFIDATLTGNTAAIYKALLTGDRSGITSSTLELFKGTGTLHILAISGIHMSLLGLFLFTLFFWLLRRSAWLALTINIKKTAAFLCLPPLLFYTLIAGAKIPVTRSFVMSLIVIMAVCYGRRHSFLPLISCAALVILILSPSQLAAPSFQLTFSAVLAITAAAPVISLATQRIETKITIAPLTKISKWIVAGGIVSLAATLGTAPLLLFHFHRIATVGVIANLIIEPLICLWALIPGFLAVLFLFAAPPIAETLLHIGAAGISLAISAAQLFNAIPHSSIFIPTPPVPLILLYYLLFVPLILRLHGKGLAFSKPVSIGLAISSIFLLLFFQPAELFKNWRTESAIYFLDVGHGSSTLIEMPGGKRVLIDGGALSSPDFDIGERVIVPFLFKKGITTIDDVIITHPDGDHFNGVPYLLSVMNVKNLWLPVTDNHSPGWQQLVRAAGEQEIPVHIPTADQELDSHGPAMVRFLANTASTPPFTNNDTGLVVRYRDDAFSILFPGDISEASEKNLLSSGTDLTATVLLAAHHGSDTSSSADFLKEVRPDLVIISSGGRRGMALPAPVVIKRCQDINATLLPLHETGTVTLRTKKGEYHFDTLLPVQHAPLHGTR